MWKIATSLGPGAAVTAAEHTLPKADKFIFYARIIGLVASAAFVVLGALRIGVYLNVASFIFGPILIVIGCYVVILEYPFVPLAKFQAFNFFAVNYMFRAGLYVAFAIPSFFSVVTFVAGLLVLASAAGYGYGHFKGAKGTEVTEQPPQDVEANNQQQQHQQQPQQEQQPTQQQRFSLRPQKGKSGKPTPEISEEAPVASKSAKKVRKSKFALSSLGAAPGGDDN